MNLKTKFSTRDFSNRFTQLADNFYQPQLPTKIKNPYIIHINKKMLAELDINIEELCLEDFCQIISGNALFEQSKPSSWIYAGHQFGHFVPQLGDGRALLLGEIKNNNNQYWELQLKGAGQTPFSRNADGRAVLRSTIREYLCSEAMAGLGIATTRSLAMIGSEEEVYREQLEMGSVMCRMSPSFIRFGTFELFASRRQHTQIKQLADFLIEHYYPQCLHENDTNPYQELFSQVVNNTAKLMAQWQSVGFSHGVMNTDNMSILGLTLDYGPFGFLDQYNPQFICNHSDHQGRYRFENQPSIALWNLNCLANAMLSLISTEEAKQSLTQYETIYEHHFLDLMRKKLGLFDGEVEQYHKLISLLFEMLETTQIDYTIFFRKLSDYQINSANTSIKKLLSANDKLFKSWSDLYDTFLMKQSLSAEKRKQQMDLINPKFILRNYIAQLVIEEVEKNQNHDFLDNILTILQSPYDEHPDMEKYAGHPPEWANRISVSCSS